MVHRLVGSGTPPKAVVKLDAWRCKKFCVLVKRKFRRGQTSRSHEFRNLCGVLAGDEQEDWL